MYCSNCGQQIDSKNIFCSNCGFKVTIEPSQLDKSVDDPPLLEQGKDIVASEIMAFLKIIGIALVVALIAIPIGLKDDSDYMGGYLQIMGDPQRHIEYNKMNHMKRLFFNMLTCSLIVIVLGRYIFKLLNWALKRQTN